MTLARHDVIRECVRHSWYAPLLRALAAEAAPSRYSQIRASLVKIKGESPGDGLISKELRALQTLGFVARQPGDGTNRPVWELTAAGRWALQVMDEFESPVPSPALEGRSSIDDGAVAPIG